jgi:heat-inducible transcriptional repressor
MATAQQERSRSKTVQELTPRQRLVLQAVVQLYVQTATPVGSRTLARYLWRQLRLSPASIRNIMAELEERKLLTHPHTSAGRIPADLGYRAYVDMLMEAQEPTPEERRVIAEALSAAEHSEELLKDATKVLSALSSALAVVRSPVLDQLRIRRIELTQLSSTALLLLVVLESELIRTLIVETPVTIPQRRLDAVVRLLNERCCGRTLGVVRTAFGELLAGAEEIPAQVVQVLQGSFDQLARNEEWSSVYISGASQLLRYPECASPERLRSITRLIDERQYLLGLLAQCEPKLQEQGLYIGIGRELHRRELWDYSLILARYRMGSGWGIVGVLGPKRMPYARLIPMVRYVAQLITQRHAQA